jgi:hypothetical protein
MNKPNTHAPAATAQTINTQTPGPLTVAALSGKITAGGMTIAASYDLRHDSHGKEEHANRRLLAASYTAFDRAGRELGIDAVDLAERIDLAALIRAARELLDAAERDTFKSHGRGQSEIEAMRRALAI